MTTCPETQETNLSICRNLLWDIEQGNPPSNRPSKILKEWYETCVPEDLKRKIWSDESAFRGLLLFENFCTRVMQSPHDNYEDFMNS